MYGLKSIPIRRRTHAFTLVELLIVMTIFLILTAIALPLVKKNISDQKTSRTSQNIEAFFDGARSRAIADGRLVGVRIERTGTTGSNRSTSLGMRQLIGVPPYSGDAADSVAVLKGPGSINLAEFDDADNPLLFLSAMILNDGVAANDHTSPIRLGDILELPGGRTVPITAITGIPVAGPVTSGPVTVRFNLFEPTGGVDTFPAGGRAVINTTAGDRVKYRIHRSPTPSTSTVLAFPRGLAIDLNYSGIGFSGNQFAPHTNSATTGQPIPGPVDILFDSSGSVSRVVYRRFNTSTMTDEVRSEVPQGLIFLCIGDTKGVADVDGTTAADREDLFSSDKRTLSNILNEQTIWLVLNPASGRASSVGIATTTVPTGDTTDPTNAGMGAALQAARAFAAFSDSLASQQ